MLVPIEFLTTKRFYEATQGIGGRIYIPNARIPFDKRPGVKAKSPAFGSVIIKIQESWEVELLDLKEII